MAIPDRKLDYLFNWDIAADAHNTPRAIQNAQQMQRLGLWDTLESREFVSSYLAPIRINP